MNATIPCLRGMAGDSCRIQGPLVAREPHLTSGPQLPSPGSTVSSDISFDIRDREAPFLLDIMYNFLFCCDNEAVTSFFSPSLV